MVPSLFYKVTYSNQRSETKLVSSKRSQPVSYIRLIIIRQRFIQQRPANIPSIALLKRKWAPAQATKTDCPKE
ncbi:hypothetical protein T07_12136 [Trichinella nelsoni]|uniref:Uncharacterized protein n=1 Tax=Trichinella nelsoni TaxID=6336 RepID=A0A0V0RYA7_9BILA|nr:hypothetical protein T07_12136 [Trichinella nelsoni]